MIEIWCLNVESISMILFKKYLDILPEKVKNEIIRYKFLRDQKCKLFGKILVQKYYEYNGFDLKWAAWNLNENGKPFVHGAKKFNITHSGDYVCVAFSDVEVGLDIEMIKLLDYNALLSYLHIDEKRYISQALCKLTAFYYVWTRKEAFYKANSVGIVRGLNNESCLNSVFYDQREWSFLTLNCLSSYLLAVCSLLKDPKVILKQINPCDLSLGI